MCKETALLPISAHIPVQRAPLYQHSSPHTCARESVPGVSWAHGGGPCVSIHSPVQGHSCGKSAQLSCKPTSLHTQHSALPTHPQASCTPSPCASTALCKHTAAPVHPALVQTHFPALTLPSMHTHPLCKPGALHTQPSGTPSPRAIPHCCTPPCTPRTTPGAGRTLMCARGGCEGADALAGPEGPEGPEGLRGGPGEGAAHAGRFLHVHLARGLPAARLADLRALRARVGVAAARERARQPLLRRHHLEPVPWGAPHGDTEGRCGHVGTRGDDRMWARVGEQQDGDAGGYG